MDRSTKIILIAIAAGLWANVIRPAVADSMLWSSINHHLEGIETYTQAMEMNIFRIAKGECQNKRLC